MAHRVNIETLERILARQEPRRFWAEYQPSIRATVAEAPRISRPSTIPSAKLGRIIHTLSDQETSCVLLALLHPGLVDLHEQSMIPRWPAVHPLDGMPGVEGTGLPVFWGSVEVAERLDYLDALPLVTERRPGEEADTLVFPYIGDLLLFLRDDDGLYCLNWSVKAQSGDHVLPGPEVRKPYSARDMRKARARFEIEIETYADVGIRTVAAAASELDPTFVENLGRIHRFLRRRVSLCDSAHRYALNCFSRGVDVGEPPREIVTYLIHRGICDRDEALTVFYTAVAEGQLRVDLFRSLLVDYTVPPERVDPIVRYKRWFDR